MPASAASTTCCTASRANSTTPITAACRTAGATRDCPGNSAERRRAGARASGGDSDRRRLAGLVAERANLAGDLAAFLDVQLAVADLAIDLAGGMDDELAAGDQFALEAAADFGDVDADLADEHAGLGNAHNAAVHRRLDAPFDDQGVAVEDFRALEFDVRADDQSPVGAGSPCRRGRGEQFDAGSTAGRRRSGGGSRHHRIAR